MFWNKKNPENCEKKNGLLRALDKIMMGIVIGGAIGSVIGMAVAPKKGKETRELLKKKGEALLEKGRKMAERSQEGKWAFSDDPMRQIPHEEVGEKTEKLS